MRTRRLSIPLVLLTHPFEIALGVVLLVNGVRGLLGESSPSVNELPAASHALYLAISTLGGVGLLFGLCTQDGTSILSSKTVRGRAIERASLFLVAASYAALGVLVVAVNGSRGVGTGLLTVVIALACGLRIIAIRKASLAVLRTLRSRS